MHDQHGIALVSALAVILVLVLTGALVLYLTGKEIAFTTLRLSGAQSLNIAEGGAVRARSALMALFNADPIRYAPDDPPVLNTLTPSMLDTWYNNGTVSGQNSFALLNYLWLDGANLTVSSSSTTASVALDVNWALSTPRFKLQTSTGTPPANTLGEGTYQATVTLTRRLAPHPFDATQPQRYIQRLGGAYYEYYYTYTIVSDGVVNSRFRRRVQFSGDFSIRIRRQNFAQFSLFTNVHMTPAGSAIWFVNDTSFDGPVHTNGEFRFAFFPKFGTPDPGTPCNLANVRSTSLTSVATTAWFNNNGSPRRLSANENVVNGVRRDAPVLPDCTPSTTTDDNDNAPANFTRGVAAIPMPTNVYSQQGVAIGRDPADTSTVTNLQVRQAIPELPDNTSAVPTGIYVPVQDSNGNGVSNAGEPMGGGIYVQGDLNSLSFSYSGPSNNLAVYTLVQGTQTVTVTVDRAANQTTVTNTAWPSPQTRTFTGVPKGWQQPDPDLANATIVFVNGNILSVGGTLQQGEQTTVVATGRIDITNHIRYQSPPDPYDPNSNPTNLLGLFSASNDIRIAASAPNDLVIHAILMAGNPSDSYNSSVNVENYNSRPPSGSVHLLGGIIEEYYGAFGTFNSSTGSIQTGYGRDFRYDRRMSRGFSPPYYPTINVFDMASSGLAGVRPTWRETAP
jgi:hypothetical protein